MIHAVNMTKYFRIRGQKKYIVRDLSVSFPEKVSVGLMGRNGTGKSTLLKILGRQMRPNSGYVVNEGSVSWQIGFAGSFHPLLTGRQNVRFIARVYGVDSDELCDFSEEFAELGPSFDMPVRTYSAGMRARLSYGVTMGIPFKYYLVDEVTAVGDRNFREKCIELLHDRLSHAGSIFVSHNDGVIREHCSQACVLENGVLLWFDDVEEAIDVHNHNMKHNCTNAWVDLQ